MGIHTLLCWGRQGAGKQVLSPGDQTGESWGLSLPQMLRPKRRRVSLYGGEVGMGQPGQCYWLPHWLIITITQGTVQTTPIPGHAPDLLNQNLGGERVCF